MIKKENVWFFVFLIPAFLGVHSCAVSKNEDVKRANEVTLRDKYKVYKIDSIKNVYLIYARKDEVLYKIASLKQSGRCDRDSVKVGGEYSFMLFSQVPKEYNGMDVSPNTIPHISGINFHGVWVEFERDSINDIFASINLKGLCVQ